MDTVNELTLLLIYLTSWEEDGGLKKLLRSWKGYRFEALNELTDKGYLFDNKGAKSVYLTEEGIRFAEQLKRKYSIQP